MPIKKSKILKKRYYLIFIPEHPSSDSKGYCFEHRIVVEKFIGRFLTNNEIIHHINGNRADNRIENLMLFKDNKSHQQFHAKIRQFGMTNPIFNKINNRWKDCHKSYPSGEFL